MENEFIEEEVVYEIRGREDKWHVHYPDEGDIQTSFVVYDKEGNFKEVIYSGGTSGKLTESFAEFTTPKQAIKYAKELGAETIKLIRLKERKRKAADG